MIDLNKRSVVYGGVLLAVGLVLSVVIHSIGGQQFGTIFGPLNFVALTTGIVAGPWVGLTVGIVLPLLSGILFGMPPLMPPIAIFMALQLGTYGILTGLFEKRHMNVYLNLAISIVAGGVVYSLGYYVIGYMVGIHLQPLTAILLSFALGFPGIIIQFLLIPAIRYSIKCARKS